MADEHETNLINGHVIKVTAPGVDYGLKNDDGFDPSKYEFYNPSNRSAATAFLVSLNEQRSTSDNRPYSTPLGSSEPYETDSPPSLSPIEELDDDFITSQPPLYSSRALPDSIEVDESQNDDVSLADNPDNSNNAIEPIAPLEKYSELLFSREHLQLILADSTLSIRFTNFLRTYRPDSVPILAYYLDAVKALKTIRYAEAIIRGLEPIPGHDFTSEANSATMAWVMEDKADRALDVLVKDDLPAFIAYIYVRMVDVALVDMVTGNEDQGSRGIADGLAEVFVISDPSRPDNPIVFTSEEFHRLTGYPRTEFLGRNCRILGGARTSPFGIARFRSSLDAERENCEVLLNYRKDGSPFINLIMCVPLRDQSGKVRYYLGAQLDITNIVNDCTGLATLEIMVKRDKEHQAQAADREVPKETIQQDEFEQLSEAFNPQELEKLTMLRRRQQLQSDEGITLTDSEIRRRGDEEMSRTAFTGLDNTFQLNGQGSAPPLGYYKSYLLVRPYPSLRILFASPDLRIPGILQSPLLNRIGGSSRVRGDLAHALEIGRKVTAKVQWVTKNTTEPHARWIHCTPLLGVNDTVGVWMVILVDGENDGGVQREQVSQETSSVSRLASSYTADALPWDERRQRTDMSGVSTSIWSDTAESKRFEEASKSKPRRSIFRQPPEMDDSAQQSFVARPGPKIAGRAYSFTSNSDRRISIDEESRTSTGVVDDRPSSQGRTIGSIQSTMQPKVRIAGRPSFEGHGSRQAPVNMPGPQNSERDAGMGDGRAFARRTYKSLSPYGILFEN